MELFRFDRAEKIKHFTNFDILIGKNPCTSTEILMSKDEIYVLQLVAKTDTNNIINHITCKQNVRMYCVNHVIVDKFGATSSRAIPLSTTALQPLFFVIDARAYSADSDTSTVIFDTANGKFTLNVKISLTNEKVANSGCDDLWRLSRLDWLNSSLYIDDTVVPPFTAPQVDGNTITILGRDIEIGALGMPSNITSYFDEGVNIVASPTRKLFSAPSQFSVGEDITNEKTTLVPHPSYVEILSTATTTNLDIKVDGILRYEGYISYKVKLTAKCDCTLSDISTAFFFEKSVAKYSYGFDKVGGLFATAQHSWNKDMHHDCYYIGDINLGARVKWTAENYVKPLINIYYKNMPLVIPDCTWDNHGNGRVSVLDANSSQNNLTSDVNIVENKLTSANNPVENKSTSDNNPACTLVASTGEFKMTKGEVRTFNFEMHITPFKPIDYAQHYAVRYSHNNHLKNEFAEIDRAEKLGLNNVIVHHGNPIHPFINYPFIEFDRLKKMTAFAKSKNIGVKVYYTVREHSNHMAEVFAYKSLGDEIILRQKGNGYAWSGGTAKWLTEYFGDKIIPAWKVVYRTGKYCGDPDVSFIVRPNSRLDNYYIEGLDYLVKNAGIKGIYIDDTALDRTTIERAKKALCAVDGLIDMHMWNHEEERAGNVSCMSLYLELFPFLDSLWIGEGYNYPNLSPDYIITEVAGLPYGLTSQMLEGGGNPYIGMLYAMNNRYGWGAFDAPRIYKLWDEFAIQNSTMLGYWHSKNPAKTSVSDIYITAYKKSDALLLCLFNFSSNKQTFAITLDSSLLEFTPTTAATPKVKGLQKEKAVDLNAVTLKGKDGIFIICK